jgi:hypothetical protein
MAGSSRRGRPKSCRPAHDHGTPELREKRRLALTSEPIDLCLERMLITRSQHWSGMHFRWLYTIRYGVPVPKAVDLTQEGISGTLLHQDIERQAECEEEYGQALEALRQHRCLDAVMALCVFGRIPASLYRSFMTSINPAHRHEIFQIREGLDVLATLWRRRLQQLQLVAEEATS